ncbi:transposase [Candidatus Poribacteria bacterium]|nr:transposase [Candidatus Poribacteria bacterium]
MSKSKTLSFILELPLKVNAPQEATLHTRFEAGRQLYNAILGEAKRRQKLLRESKAFHVARKMPKGKQRTSAFKKLNECFIFREYDLHKYATEIRRSWIGKHIDSNTAQKTATRAFAAVEKLRRGGAKKVRFKGKNQFDSVEGKTNTTGIRFKNNQILWGKLSLDCMIDESDPVVAHGLKQRVKFCRLIKRKLNGRIRFFAQLILEGIPYQKHQFPPAEVGLDIGPSTIAHVSFTDAQLETFCAPLENKQKEIRRLQRKLDRQRRANNPQNYNADGTIKKGRNIWHDSNQYIKTKNQLNEIQRKQAAHRKSLHGNLANRILKQGNVIKTEKLSYKSFQRNWGKSVGFRAPAMLVEMLRRKAENAGGAMIEFPTTNTKLSQYCHACGEYHKKPLSQRVHTHCGLNIQRDVYSAFLALSVKDNALDVPSVNERWLSMETMLRTASLSGKESQVAKVRQLSNRESSDSFKRLVRKVSAKSDKAQDVVAEKQLLLFTL